MKNGVIAIVQMPPPTTGASTVNELVVLELMRTGKLYAAHDVSPGGYYGLLRPIVRMLRVCAAARGVAFAWGRAGAVYMPCDGGYGLVFNIAIALLARLLGMKLWLHHHSFAYINKRRGLMALLMMSVPANSCNIFLCEDMASRFQERYSREWRSRIVTHRVVGNAFLDLPRNNERPQREHTVIGHLSNLSREKGARRFIDIYRSLRNRGVLVEAMIAGPIMDLDTRIAIDRAKIEFGEQFNWVGAVYGDNKIKFYSSIDVFVFPSNYEDEAQPLVLLEALSQGVPIVAVSRGCIKGDHFDSPGEIIDIEDFDEMAVHRIQKLISIDKAARSEAARHAYLRHKKTNVRQFTQLIADMG